MSSLSNQVHRDPDAALKALRDKDEEWVRNLRAFYDREYQLSVTRRRWKIAGIIVAAVVVIALAIWLL